MKTLFFLCISLVPILSFGQWIQCYDWQRGTLSAEVHGDTVIFKNDNANRNCYARYVMEVTRSNDTLIWMEHDTGDLAGCVCNFNMSVTMDSLKTGHYYLKAYYQKLEGGDTICFIGLIGFDIIELNNYMNNAMIAQGQSSCFPTGINELRSTPDDLVQIFPDPATSYINVKSSDLSTKEIFIYNMQGKLVIETTSSRIEYKIDVSNLPNGLYLMTILSKDKSVRSKFCKL